jgi:hypothetical protein
MNKKTNKELYHEHKFLQNYYLVLTILEELELLQFNNNAFIVISRDKKQSYPLNNLFDIQINQKDIILPFLALYDNKFFNDSTTLCSILFQIAEDINRKEYSTILNDYNVLDKNLLLKIFNVFIEDNFSNKFLQYELDFNLSNSSIKNNKLKI